MKLIIIYYIISLINLLIVKVKNYVIFINVSENKNYELIYCFGLLFF